MSCGAWGSPSIRRGVLTPSEESCRAHEAELVRLGVLIPEASSIRRVAALQPYVSVLSRELAALSQLEEDPSKWGFFVAEPAAIDLGLHGWEGTSGASIPAADC